MKAYSLVNSSPRGHHASACMHADIIPITIGDFGISTASWSNIRGGGHGSIPRSSPTSNYVNSSAPK
ncbi:MAG: hypothetical protein HRT88_13220 [Lentisphaeraceae bacterium]|nr:hypothetical protein [Lentisphaeraceae bacterium]